MITWFLGTRLGRIIVMGFGFAVAIAAAIAYVWREGRINAKRDAKIKDAVNANEVRRRTQVIKDAQSEDVDISDVDLDQRLRDLRRD